MISTLKRVTLSWSEKAWEDFQYWLDHNKPKARKPRTLIKECMRTPLKVRVNQPPLKGNFSGFWSRRIDQEHRLVYAYNNDNLFILQCHFNY